MTESIGLIFRYLTNGTMKHSMGYRPESQMSRCGRTAMWHDTKGWMGDGSEEERARLASMGLCGLCRHLIHKDQVKEEEAQQRKRAYEREQAGQ